MSTQPSAAPSPAEPSALARDLAEAFGQFGPAYFKRMTSRARETGVTWARMRLLHILACGGPRIIMSTLRDELGVTARSVTALVDALERDDLVRRVPHPTDRRATIIELTAAGRAAYGAQHAHHTASSAEVFAALDPDDQTVLLRIVRQLVTTLAEEAGGPCAWRGDANPAGDQA